MMKLTTQTSVPIVAKGDSILSTKLFCGVTYVCQNYTEQYKGAAAHTVTTRLQVRKGERQMEDGDYERR